MTTPCILVDIDGTIADIRHRLHHIRDGADWDAFFAAAVDDTPIGPMVKLLDLLCRGAADYVVILCSGCPERLRAITEAWCNCHSAWFDFLYLRPDGDTRPDHVVKREMLARIRADGYSPFLVIDDRASVVDMWRSEGLVCLQAAPEQLPIPATAMLTLMVGPSGAGKTTWLELNGRQGEASSGYSARHAFGIERWHVISSDLLRHELFGDFTDQSSPSRVFDAVHALALARLRLGLPVVIDATHLRRKDRMAAAQLVPTTVPVRYLVFNRSIEDKQKTGGWRLSQQVRGTDLITAHDRTFRAQLKDILAGDGLPNVTVHDLRQAGG